jgi:DNA-binding HxlR family transcriptional regulator
MNTAPPRLTDPADVTSLAAGPARRSGSRAAVGDADAINAQRCSIAGTLEALGDTWSILVLRELFFGVRRFNDIQQDLGISRSVLTDRLDRLIAAGVVRRRQYQEPGERARHEYRLTRKGVALLPTMVALMNWGDEYVYDGEAPVELRVRDTGERVFLELRSESGAPVQPNEMAPRVIEP